LAKNDWDGLTMKKLQEIFGNQIATPLEDLDSSFCLSVDHLSTKEHVKKIFEGRPRDDLEKVQENLAIVDKQCQPDETKISISDTGTMENLPMCPWYRICAIRE